MYMNKIIIILIILMIIILTCTMIASMSAQWSTTSWSQSAPYDHGHDHHLYRHRHSQSCEREGDAQRRTAGPLSPVCVTRTGPLCLHKIESWHCKALPGRLFHQSHSIRPRAWRRFSPVNTQLRAFSKAQAYLSDDLGFSGFGMDTSASCTDRPASPWSICSSIVNVNRLPIENILSGTLEAADPPLWTCSDKNGAICDRNVLNKLWQECTVKCCLTKVMTLLYCTRSFFLEGDQAVTGLQSDESRMTQSGTPQMRLRYSHSHHFLCSVCVVYVHSCKDDGERPEANWPSDASAGAIFLLYSISG